METVEMILAVLLGLSEALALIPQVKANGIFDFVFQMLKKLVGSGE